MAKAVLVLDEMPKYCNDCKIAIQDIGTETFKCPLCLYYSYLWGAERERPDVCPLHEMPEPFIPEPAYYTDEESFQVGYNAALDDVEGKNDE